MLEIVQYLKRIQIIILYSEAYLHGSGISFDYCDTRFNRFAIVRIRTSMLAIREWMLWTLHQLATCNDLVISHNITHYNLNGIFPFFAV